MRGLRADRSAQIKGKELQLSRLEEAKKKREDAKKKLTEEDERRRKECANDTFTSAALRLV